MSEDASTLYAKLLGETARIEWPALEPFFARGALLWVAPSLDLIAVAQAVAEDDRASVAAWLDAGEVEKLSATRAVGYAEGTPELWAVVVSPWVVIQERA
ncbi:DUF2288 domain-containing protein [Pseudomonas sp. KNUC1026]|uniref:DUF2288 domain-containing protein n=1 Tax=Pseudomonas sp. KNUC1026 TaxID=2893890 RepID=UPI001F3FFA09|nr:DUF2288 domain-containing protein [Pseudomonas sp. KNUC1026]UFH51537.1 DUF2288 domain-containing protein [Pseudomonas sp. KNUC1026]